jgi:hypothetical protein
MKLLKVAEVKTALREVLEPLLAGHGYRFLPSRDAYVRTQHDWHAEYTFFCVGFTHSVSISAHVALAHAPAKKLLEKIIGIDYDFFNIELPDLVNLDADGRGLSKPRSGSLFVGDQGELRAAAEWAAWAVEEHGEPFMAKYSDLEHALGFFLSQPSDLHHVTNYPAQAYYAPIVASLLGRHLSQEEIDNLGKRIFSEKGIRFSYREELQKVLDHFGLHYTGPRVGRQPKNK